MGYTTEFDGGVSISPPLNAREIAYLRKFAAETLELPVTSAGVSRDLDTPTEYEQLMRAHGGRL